MMRSRDYGILWGKYIDGISRSHDDSSSRGQECVLEVPESVHTGPHLCLQKKLLSEGGLVAWEALTQVGRRSVLTRF